MTGEAPRDARRDRDWPLFAEHLDRLLDLSAEEAELELGRLARQDELLARRLGSALASARIEDQGPIGRPAAESWPELVLGLGGDDTTRSESAPGSRIGSWRLGAELGRGGMGTVYAAERADGSYEKSAALKLLRLEVDLPELRERFERERRILARLEHPAIARLLDGGLTANGRPFLVLERVDGEAITTYCDRRKLDVEARLRLFLQVLDGVEFAHRNLVVHRDLKPSNVLVAAPGTVKLVDFGVAKLLDESDPAGGDRTLTRQGAPLTPQYAAPEQLTGAAITTATDVYALGLLLYELLSGARPYRSAGRSSSELERDILHGTRIPPSVSARRCVPELAARRGTTPGRLARRLDGDLDAVALRAVAPEPERRYRTAADLRRDVENHLAGRPVEARPDSLSYRALKFVRRHPFGVVATIALLVSLIAGLTALGYALVEARGRLDEARRAEAIQTFLLGLFEEADPARTRGREPTVRDLLDAGSRRLEAELGEQPRTRAELLGTVGNLYLALGDLERAGSLLDQAIVATERTFGTDAPEVGRLLVSRAHLENLRDDDEHAFELAGRAITIFRETRDGSPSDLAEALVEGGSALYGLARFEEAAARHREALALDRSAPGAARLDVARDATALATTLIRLGDHAAAVALAEEALAIRRSGLPSDHPDIGAALHILALARNDAGDLEGAESAIREALAILRKVYGDRHPTIPDALDALVTILNSAGRAEEGLKVSREALSVARETLPPGNPGLAVHLNNLAVHCYRLRDLDCAESSFLEVLEIWRREFGERHLFVATARNNLGMVRLERGDAAGALSEVGLALEIRRETRGEESPEVAQSYGNRARVELALKDLSGAARDAESSVDLSRRVYPDRNPFLANALVTRARVALARGEHGPARIDFEEAFAIRRERLGDDSPLTAEVRAELAALDGVPPDAPRP